MRIVHNGVDISGAYQPAELEAINVGLLADVGEAGTGVVPIPENAGALTFYAGQHLRLTDDTGAIVIVDGFVGAVSTARGETAGGTRILPAVTIVDENAMLAGIRAYRWSRGSETDVERMRAWALKFRSFLDRTTWVPNTNTVVQDKKVYTTEESIGDLVNDMQDQAAKTLYIQDDELHWHLFTEGPTAGLAISDAAYDYVTTFPPYNPTKLTDPAELGNNVLAFNSKGQTQRATDPTSIARHDAAGKMRHQRLLDLPDSSTSGLLSHARGIIARDKEERFTYECDIGPLTHAQVALIRKGSLILATSAVMGLSASTQRIAQLGLSYKHPDLWMAHVTMGFPRRTRKAPRPVKPPVTPPTIGSPFVPDATITDTFDRPDDSSLGTADCGRVWVNNLGPGAIQSDEGLFTSFGGNQKHLPGPWPADFHMTVDVLEATAGAFVNIDVNGHAGVTAENFQMIYTDTANGGPTLYVQAIDGSRTTSHTSTLAADEPLPLLVDFRVDATGVHAQVGLSVADALFSAATPSAMTPPDDMNGNLNFTLGNGTTRLDNLDVDGVPGVGHNAPTEGQFIGPEGAVGDGTTTTYTTTWEPYAAGSLVVKINGAVVAVTESPDLNQFTLPFPAAAGATITWTYNVGPEAQTFGQSNPVPPPGTAYVPPPGGPGTVLGGDGVYRQPTATAVPAEAPNGTRTVFTIPPYIADSPQVYVNGLIKVPTADYAQTSPGTGVITLVSAPAGGAKIVIVFQPSRAILTRPFPAPVTTATYTIPGTIDNTGATEVGADIDAWIDSVPDYSICDFGGAANIFQMHQGLQIPAGRHGLVLWGGSGAGAKIKGTPGTSGADQLNSQIIIGHRRGGSWSPAHGSTDIVIDNFVLEGNNPSPGNFTSGTEGAANLEITGVDRIEIKNITGSKAWGDFLFWEDVTNGWAHDCHAIDAGRDGTSVISGDTILMQQMAFDRSGQNVIDVEPNTPAQACYRVVLEDFTFGSFGNEFLGVEGTHTGAPIDTVKVTRGVGSGAGATLRSTIDNGGALGTQMKNISLTNCAGVGTIAGPVVDFHHVDNPTASGNTQALSSGAFASFASCTNPVV